MADQLNANLSRFSAYKAAHIEKAFNGILNDPKMTDEQRRIAVRAAEEKFARWTDAEYNTATARCITAEQFAEFNDPEHTSLFPNLEWLATRSTNPREEHQAFVGLILPKTHDFWRTHTPGTEWNCKCDLAETDDPATNAANLPTANVPKGLEGNPFYTGEVFTKDVGYIRNIGKLNLDAGLASKYPALQQLVDMDSKAYRADYYSDEGGLLKTSRDRIKEGDKNKQEKEKFDKEHAMCLTLAKVNHIVDYRASVEGEFDIFLDGKKADLKQTNSHNNIVKYGKKAIRKQGADLVVFEFGEINAHILNELAALQRIGIHGYYMVGGILVPF